MAKNSFAAEVTFKKGLYHFYVVIELLLFKNSEKKKWANPEKTMLLADRQMGGQKWIHMPEIEPGVQ